MDSTTKCKLLQYFLQCFIVYFMAWWKNPKGDTINIRGPAALLMVPSTGNISMTGSKFKAGPGERGYTFLRSVEALIEALSLVEYAVDATLKN